MAKNTAFGKAFASARKAGKKNFTFGGKSYNTKVKEESSSKEAPVPVKRSVKDKVRVPSLANAKASAASGKLKNGKVKKKSEKKGHGIAMGKYRLK